MRKKINTAVAVRTLARKGVKIESVNFGNSVDTIDISKAKDMGNKSWGYVDFFRKSGFLLIGLSDFVKRNRHSAKEKSLIEVKEITTVKKNMWHSLEDFANDKQSAEYQQLRVMNDLQTKFNNNVFKKNKKDKAILKKRKLNLSIPFENKIMLVWNSDSSFPIEVLKKDQVSHRERKLNKAA